MKRDIDAIAAGHVCLDIIPGFASERPYRIEEVFSPGKIVDVQAAAISTGGPVSNTGIAGLTELNANDSMVLNTLAVVEASAGDTEAAKVHAMLAIRLNPKDPFNHPAYLALAMATFIDGEPKFEEWGNRAIQLSPNAPIRRAMMIAHAAENGDQAQIKTHLKELQRISPDFIGSLFRGENQVFQKPEHMAKLLDGLRKAGIEG